MTPVSHVYDTIVFNIVQVNKDTNKILIEFKLKDAVVAVTESPEMIGNIPRTVAMGIEGILFG